MKNYSAIEKLKILTERIPGMSWCLHCGKTWNSVEIRSIGYSTKMPDFGSGMFPVCKKCFDELSSDEIFAYCKELVDKWEIECINNIDFDVIRYNIDYLKMKEEKIDV
jgi:hypothetical protein